MQRYFEQLFAHLVTEGSAEFDFELFWSGWRGNRQHIRRLKEIQLADRLRKRWLPLPQTLVEARGLRALSAYLNTGITHSFGTGSLPRKLDRLVLTLQDIISLKCAGELVHDKNAVERWIAAQLEDAKSITTISEFSKLEISSYFSIDESRIAVIPNGVDHERFRPLRQEELAAADAVLHNLGISVPYILTLGGTIKRKNLANLIEAFGILKRNGKIEHKLVLAGPQQLSEDAQLAVDRNSLHDDIVSPGYIEDCDVRAVLGRAHVFVFPSLYEGFGLPPLEAMACGVPVASSNAASLPEVGGDAVRYFDPSDPSNISEVLYELIGDEQLWARCRTAGLARSSLFSWQRAAQRMLEVYTSLRTIEQ